MTQRVRIDRLHAIEDAQSLSRAAPFLNNCSIDVDEAIDAFKRVVELAERRLTELKNLKPTETESQ